MKRLQKYVDKKIDNTLDHVTDRITRTFLGDEQVQRLQHDHHNLPTHTNPYSPDHVTSPQNPYHYPYHHHNFAAVTSPSSAEPYSPAIHPHHVQPPIPPSHSSFPPHPSVNPSPPAPAPTPNPHATKKFKWKPMFKQESKPTSQKEKTAAVLDEVFNTEPQRKPPSVSKSPTYAPFTPGANPSTAIYGHVPNSAFHNQGATHVMDAYMDKAMPPEMTAKKYQHRTAIADLEQAQDAMPGPRWTLANVVQLEAHLRGPNSELCMSNLRYALSGIENGVTFSTLNSSRYNELGDSVLNRVLVGLSRPIDLSTGMQDLRMLASQVMKRDMAAIATSIQDIRNSAVPIFAILYEPEGGGASSSTGFGIDQSQMEQLYTILHTLTAGRKARIWLVDIAMLSFSRGARWERLSIIPFALFPAIVLRGLKYEKRFGILRTVHERVAMDCLGVIQLDAPTSDLEEKFSVGMKVPRLPFRSRENPRVTKMLGSLKKIQSSLCAVAVDVLNGVFPGYVPSPNGDTNEEGVEQLNLRELRTLSIFLMRGESLSNVVLGLGNAERACKLDGHEDKVFKNLAKYSRVYDNPIKPQKAPSTNAGKWNGVVEFVGDLEVGRGLGLQKMKRTYLCAYHTKSQWIAALGKVEGDVELYGLLLIRRTSTQPQSGIVEMYFPNFPAKRMLPSIFMYSTSKSIVSQSLFSLVLSHIEEGMSEVFQPGTDWQVVNLTYEEIRWS